MAFSLAAPRSAAPRDPAARKKITFGCDWILTQYASVTQCLTALRQGDWRLPVAFLALADAHTVAFVEVAPDGRFAIQGTANGVLWHANAYQDAPLLDCNPPPRATTSRSEPRSQRRLRLAQQQLHSKKQFNVADILDFASDPTVRYTLPNKRTYATFLVHHRPQAPTELVIRLFNPDEPVREARMTLEQALSGEGLRLLR